MQSEELSRIDNVYKYKYTGENVSTRIVDPMKAIVTSGATFYFLYLPSQNPTNTKCKILLPSKSKPATLPGTGICITS